LTNSSKNDKMLNMSYDKKVSEEALKYRGKHKQAETSEILGVSVSAIKDWQELQKEKGKAEKKKLKRKGRKIGETELKADVEAYRDDLNWERAVRFGCTEEGNRKAMKRHKLTGKKDNRIL
jgi:transposase